MVSEARDLEALVSTLKNKNVPASLITYMTETDTSKGLGLANPDDFVNYVKHEPIALFEGDLTTKILVKSNIDGVKDSPLVLSRLKQAYLALKSEFDTKLSRKKEGVPIGDWEDPLESSTQEGLFGNFNRCYTIVLTAHGTPADNLIARLYREVTRNLLSVHEVLKVRTLAMAQRPVKERRSKLGDYMVLFQDSEDPADDETPNSVLWYLLLHRVLMNGYAIVGTHQVESKKFPGTKVPFAALSDVYEYTEVLHHRAVRLVGSGADALGWMQQRDQETRAKAVVYTRKGWPLGEALLEAYKDEKVEWTVMPSKRKAINEHPDAVSTPEKKSRVGTREKPLTSDKDAAGQLICKPRNDNRGCVAKESNCPTKRVHCCDVINPDTQKVCGSKEHTRATCPLRDKYPKV